jgi:hypothetical protein
MTIQVLDSLPIAGVFALLVGGFLLVYEIGFRIGRWYQKRTPGEQEGPTGALVGSILGLLAFLLAVTMGMAADRFDARRGLVLSEANAIGTTYLRAAFLPEPDLTEARTLLREYAPLRVTTTGEPARLAASLQRSAEIQNALWTQVEGLAADGANSETFSLYVDSLNELIDISEARVIAGLTARVPETILWLLIIFAGLSMAMVGYSAGLTERRSMLTAVALVVVLAAVLTLVVDIDRPRDGFLMVTQQPLLDVIRQMQAR